MNDKTLDELRRGLSKVIKKYTKDGYFDLVDGYIPLETFILKVLAQQKEEIKEIVEGIETAKGSGWVKLRDVLEIIKNL